MGGFEIRPVTAADLEELLSGRCACGCSAPSPAAEALLAGYPADVVGMEFDFAANVDGRWAPSWAAFGVELDRLDEARQAVVGAGERPLSALSDGEQFVFGVWAASQWTLGQSQKPPCRSFSSVPGRGQHLGAEVLGEPDCRVPDTTGRGVHEGRVRARP
jgi:hypothetical protein